MFDYYKGMLLIPDFLPDSCFATAIIHTNLDNNCHCFTLDVRKDIFVRLSYSQQQSFECFLREEGMNDSKVNCTHETKIS